MDQVIFYGLISLLICTPVITFFFFKYRHISHKQSDRISELTTHQYQLKDIIVSQRLQLKDILSTKHDDILLIQQILRTKLDFIDCQKLDDIKLEISHILIANSYHQYLIEKEGIKNDEINN